ncbi:TPA: hypothetical protein ACPQXG_000043 [Streptococcus mutans]
MNPMNSPVAKLTRNMMIIDLMKQTGWSRDRAIAAIEELEDASLISFPNRGGLRLRTNVEVN